MAQERLSIIGLVEIELGLDPTCEKVSLKKEIRNCLRRRKVYGPSNLYRFIPGENSRKANLVTKGTDHPEFDSVFAFNHQEIFGVSSLLPEEYLFNYGEEDCSFSSMIAVYDSCQFTDDGLHHYTFNNSENRLRALMAVIYVKPKS